MGKKLIIVILGLLYLGGCKSPSPKTIDEIVVIDVDKALGSAPKELNLSDFVDSISFIPVYDGNTAFIGEASRMIMTADHLFIYDMASRLVCYNFEERKSRQIGTRGRGPNEYIRMEAIAVDEANNLVYALCRNDSSSPGAVLKYDFEGHFLGKFNFDESGDKIGLTDEGNVVIHFTNYFGNSKYQYLVMDGEGQTKALYYNPFLYRPSERSAYFSESAGYSYCGEFHLKDKSDTLYVFRGAERHPKYVFKNQFSIDGNENLTRTDYDEAFVLSYVFETDTKLVFNGNLGGPEYDKWHPFYYDKTTGQTHLIEGDVANDLTGYPKLFRQVTSDTTFEDCYVKLYLNTHSTEPGYPQDEKASYFLALFHLK